VSNPSLIDAVRLCEAEYANVEYLEIEQRHTFTTYQPNFVAMRRVEHSLSAEFTESFGYSPERLWPQLGFRHSCSQLEKPSQIRWRREGNPFENRFGYHATLYVRESDHQSLLIIRGTDDLYDGLIDDVQIAFGDVPRQVTAAYNTVAKVGVRQNLYIAGHSLGGALAILVGARLNLPVVSFNAPGVMDACLDRAVVNEYGNGLAAIRDAVARCIEGTRTMNIRITADPVSSFWTTGFQPGSTVELSASACGLSPKCRHGIKTCVDAVKARADASKPLNL
jgi:hypothetical protein